MQLPVFLPGNSRGWIQVDGVATVTSEGQVTITLSDPADADRLVELAQERVLLQVSFDYRAADDTIEKIIRRQKARCTNPECPMAGECGGRCTREFRKKVINT